MIKLYPTAKQDALDLKEGEEQKILRHSMSDIAVIEDRVITTKEYEKRKNTSYRDYYLSKREEESTTAGIFNLIGNIGSVTGDLFSGEATPTFEMDNYKDWIEEARVAIPMIDATAGDITSYKVYELDEDSGDYKITEEEIERLAELNIVPAKDQLTISEEDYYHKRSLYNRDAA